MSGYSVVANRKGLYKRPGWHCCKFAANGEGGLSLLLEQIYVPGGKKNLEKC